MYWHSTCGNGGSYGCRYIHHIDTPCQNIRPTLAATYTDTVCDIELKISDILQENKPTEARKTKLQNLNSLMPLSTHQIKSSFISISCVPVLLRNKKEKMMKENNIGTQYRSMSVANSVKIPIPAVVIVWLGDGGCGSVGEHLHGACVVFLLGASRRGHILQMYSSSSSSLSSCIHDSKFCIILKLLNVNLSSSLQVMLHNHLLCLHPNKRPQFLELVTQLILIGCAHLWW